MVFSQEEEVERECVRINSIAIKWSIDRIRLPPSLRHVDKETNLFKSFHRKHAKGISLKGGYIHYGNFFQTSIF